MRRLLSKEVGTGSAFWQERVTARATTLALPQRVKLTIVRTEQHAAATNLAATPVLRPTRYEQNINVVFGDYRCSWEGAAASVKHDPTGLYLYGGWGRQHFDNFKMINVGPQGTNVVSTQKVFDPTSTTWFIQPGIEEKWTHLGKTTIFGMYQHDEAGSNPGPQHSK